MADRSTALVISGDPTGTIQESNSVDDISNTYINNSEDSAAVEHDVWTLTLTENAAPVSTTVTYEVQTDDTLDDIRTQFLNELNIHTGSHLFASIKSDILCGNTNGHSMSLLLDVAASDDEANIGTFDESSFSDVEPISPVTFASEQFQ